MRKGLARDEIRALERQGATRQEYLDLAYLHHRTAGRMRDLFADDLDKWNRGEGDPMFADPREPKTAAAREELVQSLEDTARLIREAAPE